MSTTITNGRWFWMSVGLAAGLAIAFVWPHESLEATMADRNDKFAMVTAQFDTTDLLEGVFVLDFLTGQLRGAVISPNTGKFSLVYARDVASDFNINPNEPATFAIVSGRTNLVSRGVMPAASCVYVAELASGRVICYSFPAGGGGPGRPLVPIDSFPFRESIN